MSNPKLNKALYTDITKLKLCNKSDSPVKFILDKSPFEDDDDVDVDVDDGGSAKKSSDIIVIGRILPNSEIYRDGAYQIEMKLTNNYPVDPPNVRFLTQIYHPNVGKEGQFCHDLLKTTCNWKPDMSLVDVVKAVVHRIDNPDVDYSFSLELGKEYVEKRAEFNRKATEMVKNYALSRV